MCATSDIWSRSNKSFIAVTVHYFEDSKLVSKFIACQYFPGNHTHDRVAAKLRTIFESYGIFDKVFFVTTDGAGEYKAAFKFYGNNYRSFEFDVDGHGFDGTTDDPNPTPTSDGNFDLLSENEANSDDDDDDFFALNDANGQRDASDAGVDPESFRIKELPLSLGNMNRVDCSAHKLDKVGGIDSLKAKIYDPDYADLYDRVFGKLEQIWSQKESRISAECFARITGRKLIGPHRIRWLKTCEAVSKYLLKHIFGIGIEHLLLSVF